MLQDCAEIREWLAILFNSSRQTVKPPKALNLFRIPQSSRFQGTPQYCERFIVSLQRNWKRMAVFTAVRERKARRVGETARGSMYDFRDQRERLKRSWP
jgi:hypothetical protein